MKETVEDLLARFDSRQQEKAIRAEVEPLPERPDRAERRRQDREREKAAERARRATYL
jgi:hypothetical protein